HPHPHSHTHSHMPPERARDALLPRNLLMLGISGGILPCPTALVLLLAAISFRNIPLGLVLVLAFSVGLAGILTAIGLLVDFRGVDVGCATMQPGPSSAVECFRRYWRAFPNLRIVAGDRIAQGSQVAVAWCARGTHEGTFMHIPATGRRVTLRGVSFFTVRD